MPCPRVRTTCLFLLVPQSVEQDVQPGLGLDFKALPMLPATSCLLISSPALTIPHRVEWPSRN